MRLINLVKEQFPVITGTQILIFIILFAVLTGLLGVAVYKRLIKGWQAVCLLTAFTYLYLVLLSTVYSRTIIPQRICKWMPFWSYAHIWETHSRALADEVFMNILMLVPAALLVLPVVRRKEQLKWIAIAAFLISAFIEIQQLVFQKGWFEIDDIIHNTLGVCVCCGIWKCFLHKQE